MPIIQEEKDDKFKKLKDINGFANKIVDMWAEFHDKRNTQLDTANTLSKYLYLNQPDRNTTKAWKTNIKENKIFSTWDSMKASMWKEIWSNENQMFDVVGTSKEFEEVAERQKQAVVHSLKEMNAGVQFDLATDNWALYGEFIYKTDWKKRTKKVKRFEPLLGGYIEQELPLEENANIEAINPMFFNFDVTRFKYGDKQSWDSCPKIFKRFASVDEIKANPHYTLTKEQIEELDANNDTEPTEKKEDKDLATITKYGSQYEVLYFQGDIVFNGVSYKNVVAEVFAGKYLIFFDENPIYINPFVWDAILIDPETGRGISPLKSILEMVQAKEELINTAGDIAKLNASPPMWGSDSFLKEKYKNKTIEYEPGKYLEYENSYQGGFPQQVQFNANGLADIISVLANDISDTSSVNANVMGNVAQGNRTATDLQLAQRGSDSRTALKLDKIYQTNLKVIENVAELLAMFKNEPEMLMITDKGKRLQVEITTAIRRGSYHYIYEDRNALIDRRAKTQEALQMLNSAGNNPVLMQRIDWVEALKTGLEMLGFDNPDKFFKEPTEIDQIAETVKQMPPQIQQAIGEQVKPMLQQAQMMLQGQKNGQI